LSLFAILPAEAQSPSLPVTVRIKKGDASDFILLGRTARELRLQPPAGGGQVLLPVDNVAEVRFDLPPAYANVRPAYNAGRWPQVVSILRPIVTPMLPYLDLPNNNAVPLVLVVADSLRRSGDFSGAYDWLQPLTALPNAAQRQTGLVWSAYCKTLLHQGDNALSLLDKAGELGPGNRLFPLERLVRASVALDKKDYASAIDAAAQSTAFSPIESEWYPQTLYVSAESYRHMAETSAEEQPLSTNGYRNIATSLYKEIADLFPDSTWAKASRDHVQPVTNATAEASAQEP
jgi:hypothetical protein